MLALTFPGGKFVQDITSVTLVNATTLNIAKTVPAGKRWLLISIKALNPDNVDRVVTFSIYYEVALTNLLRTLNTESLTAAGAEALQWPAVGTAPTHTTSPEWCLVLMAPGNTLNIQWLTGGASAGATDADGLILEYLEL
mgnify:CR=1 FL=1